MSWKFFGTTFFAKKVVKKSNGAAFLGLSQALGMMVGGLAMWGGAKLDELTNNQLGKSKSSSEKESRDYILQKARENVGSPLIGESRHKPKKSNEWTDKKKKGSIGAGSRAGRATATFIQGMTGNLGNVETLKKFMGSGKEIFSDSESEFRDIQGAYAYNVMSINKKQQKEAVKLIDHGLESLLEQLQGVTLSSEGGSMSEGARSNAYNNTNNMLSKGKSKDTENLDSPFKSTGVLSNNYIEELGRLNRNNIQRISERYIESENIEEMIRNSIEEYNKRNGR